MFQVNRVLVALEKPLISLVLPFAMAAAVVVGVITIRPTHVQLEVVVLAAVVLEQHMFPTAITLLPKEAMDRKTLAVAVEGLVHHQQIALEMIHKVAKVVPASLLSHT